MKRYNKISADVLNEADKFEQRLTWYLFASEQETRLWGYNATTKWVPGDFLYRRPVEFESSGCTCEACVMRDGERYIEPPEQHPAYEGNCIRPMIQLLDDGDAHDHMRCKDCHVSWRGPEPCWMCGKKTSHWSDAIGHIESAGMTPRGFEARICLDIDPEPFRIMVQRVQERLDEMFVGMERAFRSMRGVSEMFVFYNEADVVTARMLYGNFDPIPYEVRVPEITMIFERREPEIVLVPEVAPIVSPVGPPYPRIELPENWADLRVSVPLPEVPGPREFEPYRPSYEVPITERRRRR